PESLDAALAPYREQTLFPTFPFGTDLTEEEVVLRKALGALTPAAARKKLFASVGELRKVATVPDNARPYLQRMGLDVPRSLSEKLLRRVVVYALASVGAI